MQPEHATRLRTLATKFRAAIERCNKAVLPITFEQFPHGSCGDAALLLARYLREQGAGVSRYVCGVRPSPGEAPGHSHAWLKQGQHIIDITADQFHEGHGPVLVTTDRRWHRQFLTQTEHEADYRLYDLHTVALLDAAYRRVVAHLDNAPAT